MIEIVEDISKKKKLTRDIINDINEATLRSMVPGEDDHVTEGTSTTTIF
jgi:hypothetical protein